MAYLFGFTEGLCEIHCHQIVPETRVLDGFQSCRGDLNPVLALVVDDLRWSKLVVLGSRLLPLWLVSAFLGLCFRHFFDSYTLLVRFFQRGFSELRLSKVKAPEALSLFRHARKPFNACGCLLANTEIILL
jgi:hypothetical protein